MMEDYGDSEQPSLTECQICLGEHDDDIHTATLDVHAWFHYQVTKYFEEDPAASECVA